MNRQYGFTLVEMMIVVVIVGILAAIAVPSYTKYVRRAVCEDAKGTLIANASALERYRAQNNKGYVGATLAHPFSPTSAANADKAEFSIRLGTTMDGDGACDTTAPNPGNPNNYCLSATPIGRLKDKGVLSLDSTGQRSGTDGFAQAWNSCSGI